jgi:hypothetical protein
VVRKLLRRRSVWFVVGVVAVLVFAIFVAGTTWSLLTPGYVLEDGELAADFAVLFGSLSLAALSVFRARRLSCAPTRCSSMRTPSSGCRRASRETAKGRSTSTPRSSGCGP